tara:strand:+ start:17243 stop:19249 length:2007 start_codon:yes stop_codon:yes gene_type:complete
MINWGILGTGMIARALAVSIRDSEGCNLKAVASREIEKAERFSDKYNCLPVEGYKNLLEDDELDAIYVATPHDSHFDLALASLKAKKSVLCEKPMTINSTEAMVLIDTARNNEVLLMEAFMYRTHPQTDKVRELVKKEFKKSPLTIEASFGFSADVPKEHRLVNPDLGGGSIMDIGCYPMSMSRMIVGTQEEKLFSNPISIKAKGELSERGIDLNASAELDFENGSKALISSAINKTLKNTVLISNDDKSILIEEPWQCGEQVGRKSKIIFKSKGFDDQVIDFKENKGVFTFEVDHFANLIRQKKTESKKVSHADSHGNMIWLDAWRKKIGVYYAADNPEIRKSSVLGKEALKNPKNMPFNSIRGLDKKVSRVVFGCDNQSSTDHAFAMFDHFFSLGGNAFDTAYIYNNGKSDVYLGKWMAHRGLREKVVVLGKGAHTPHCYPDLIRPQLEESLDRLQTDYLDIYCLHRDNLEVPVSEFVDALDEIKKDGLIKLSGASNWSLKRFSDAISYAEDSNKQPFSILSNNFSLAKMLTPVWPGCESCSEEEFKDYLKEKQIPIFPWSSQARGFFLDKQEFQGSLHIANPNQEEKDRVWFNEDNVERRNRCFSLAKDKGVEAIELALAFVLNQEFPSYPLIGPRNYFETRSSLKALNIDLSNLERDWLDLKSD